MDTKEKSASSSQKQDSDDVGRGDKEADSAAMDKGEGGGDVDKLPASPTTRARSFGPTEASLSTVQRPMSSDQQDRGSKSGELVATQSQRTLSEASCHCVTPA